LAVIVNDRLAITGLDASFGNGIRKGIEETLPREWSVSEFTTSVASFPRGSLNYRVTLTSQNGDTTYQFGYVVPGRIGYMFVMNSSTNAIPSVLTDVISSFRVIDPGRNTVKVFALVAFGKPLVTLMLIVFLAMMLEVIIWHRKRAARSMMEPQQAASITRFSRLLIFAGLTAAVAFTNVDADPGDSPIAVAVGALIGVLGIAFAVSYAVYGRRKRRDWNRFARLFCLLAIVIPWLSAIGNASRLANSR